MMTLRVGKTIHNVCGLAHILGLSNPHKGGESKPAMQRQSCTLMSLKKHTCDSKTIAGVPSARRPWDNLLLGGLAVWRLYNKRTKKPLENGNAIKRVFTTCLV